MNQSEELTKFYQAYAAWLDSGAPDGLPFSRAYGLCLSLVFFAPAEELLYTHTEEELREQFRTAGLDVVYPFGHDPYQTLRRDRSQHLDPNRNKWVRDHLPPT